MQVSKEFKIGLLGVIALGLFYFGFNFLKGIDFFSSTNNYYALYDNINGLTISNPVIINGLTVGRVSNIEIVQEKNNLILVEMNINDEIQIKKGTEAKLANLDFLGSKAIELIIKNSSTILEDGDTLIGKVEPGITEFLKENAGPVADNIGDLISNLNAVLENLNKNSEVINATLANFEGITAGMNKNIPVTQQKFNVLLDNLSKNSKDLTEMMKDLKPTMANARQFTDSLKTMELKAMISNTKDVMDNLNATLAKVRAGEGTMGKLMSDDSLYINLNNTARDLDLLLVNLREHPGRYVHFSMFGKKDKSDKK